MRVPGPKKQEDDLRLPLCHCKGGGVKQVEATSHTLLLHNHHSPQPWSSCQGLATCRVGDFMEPLGVQLRSPVGNLTPNGKKAWPQRREGTVCVGGSLFQPASVPACQPAEESSDSRRTLTECAGVSGVTGHLLNATYRGRASHLGWNLQKWEEGKEVPNTKNNTNISRTNKIESYSSVCEWLFEARSIVYHFGERKTIIGKWHEFS